MDLKHIGHPGKFPIMYGVIWSLQLHKEVIVICFADDIGVTIVALGIKKIEILKNEAIWQILAKSRWSSLRRA